VVGTEASELLIMDTTGTAIQSRVKLSAVPAFLAVNGLLDVDYRVVVAARNGHVYTVKNGEVSSTVIELEAQPVGLLRTNKSVIVGCMNNTLVSARGFCFSGRASAQLGVPGLARHCVSCRQAAPLTCAGRTRPILPALCCEVHLGSPQPQP